MKLSLFILTLLLSMPVSAARRNDISDPALTPETKAAINTRFGAIENRISNLMDVRSTRIKVGTFTSSGSTGNQLITGVGFRPRLLIIGFGQGDTGFSRGSLGWGTSSSAQASVISMSDSAGDEGGLPVSSSAIIRRATIGGAGTPDIVGVLVSLDADGFTINWTAASAVDMAYIAFQ